jgi:hypothetical protein
VTGESIGIAYYWGGWMYTWLLASHDAVSTTFTRLVVSCNVMRSGLPSLVMPCRIVLDGHDIEPRQSMRLRMGKALARSFSARSPGGDSGPLPHRRRYNVVARYAPRQRNAPSLHHSDTTLGPDSDSHPHTPIRNSL